MFYSNQQIAEYLQNIATALTIKKENRFRIVSYENAADTIISYPENIYDLWQEDPKSLDEVPHIGEAIFDKITYLFIHDQSHPHVAEYQKGIHPAVFTLTKINGIGPLIAQKLTENLPFSSKPSTWLDQLVEFCQQDKLSNIPGLGEKSQQSILTNTLAYLSRGTRLPLEKAQKVSQKIIDYLKSKFPQIEFVALGSLRRKSPTVGDIDLAGKLTPHSPVKEILHAFANYPDSIAVINSGKFKTSIRLPGDIRVDLMLKPEKSWGSLLQHFTGSRQHNILLRKHALKLGYSLSEYGIKDIKTKKIHYFSTESAFYDFLGFKLIPPQQRIGESELEAYQK